MAGLARVVVHVRRGGAGGPARFGQSVTGTFCPAHEDTAVVSCGLDGGRFLLSDVPFPGSTAALLKRPSFCPAKRLGEQPELALPAELRDRGVAAGVAVLLQASTGRVLLTRRAGTLSTFPNVWVPPAAGRGAAGAGGGDGAAPGSGDLLLEDARPLGVPRAAGGERAPDVPVGPRGAIPRLRAASGFRPGCVPARASVTELSTGSSSTVQLPTATFLNTAPAEGEDVERVSTGTKFALRLWLESLGEQGRAGP
ncbi:m7GpppN-mRNA hydrolase NUDT17 isoform X8 [Mycteria americana]|uniref:m7GpppN-mRNA hydrolase NUDT17 isoform X8 n=1 Tax=Mycteria americana TaxID=33587 RepID=UPI003F58F003